MIRRKRGRIHAVLTGLLDLPANVQVNHAHAKRGRSCTLSPICISICPELSDGSNSKNAISYICFSMYFLADNAKVGFFLNLSVKVKIFCIWQELSKQCFRFASDSAYYIFTEMRSSPELLGLICPRIRSNLCAQSCNAWFHHTVLRMMKYAHSAHGISGTGSSDASGSLRFHPWSSWELWTVINLQERIPVGVIA